MCVRVHDPSVCVCLAVQGAAGAAQKSKIQEWPLGEVSRSRLFAVTLESACEAHIWKGILRFRGVKSSNFFWPAGAAPQGRRGQGASRPARPGSGHFCYNNSNGRVHRKSALSAAHDFGQPLHLFPYRVPFLAWSCGPRTPRCSARHRPRTALSLLWTAAGDMGHAHRM